MPTYEYECTKCGHTFEKFQSMTEERVKRCPKCRCKVKRLLGTGAGILFKGSGFYQTDYRSSNYHSDAKRESSSAKAASESGKKDSSKKSESKAAGTPQKAAASK